MDHKFDTQSSHFYYKNYRASLSNHGLFQEMMQEKTDSFLFHFVAPYKKAGPVATKSHLCLTTALVQC